jgi:heat shock protein HtpX
MFEAIRANQRRSTLLIVAMGVILLVLGGGIGVAIEAQVRPIRALQSQSDDFRSSFDVRGARGPRAIDPLEGMWDVSGAGLWFGFAGAALIFVILWLTATVGGDRVLLSAANAHPVDKSVAPQLYNVVEEMSIAAGLPRPPPVYIIDDPSLNAFAAGYDPRKAVVAVTAGLLKRLNRDELQGVIAHEIGHIKNHDVKFMTLAGVMVGAIALISRMFLRGIGRGMGRRRGGGKGGGAALVLLIVAILLAILAPIAAQLLYFATSRRREYLADASAALFTRYPAGLASALEKIEQAAAPTGGASQVVAPLYIVNPLQGASLFSLVSTHPPTRDRIRILRSMGGAGFAAYEHAYRGVYGGARRCLGDDTLKAAANVDARAASPESAADAARLAQAMMVGDVLDRVLPLVVVKCPCGVKLKLTREWKRDTTECPRCGRAHAVPRAAPEVGARSAPNAVEG